MRFTSGVNFNTPCTGCLEALCGFSGFVTKVVSYSTNSETKIRVIHVLYYFEEKNYIYIIKKIYYIPCAMLFFN